MLEWSCCLPRRTRSACVSGHDARIRTYAEAVCRTSEVVTGDSVDVKGVWAALLKPQIKRICGEKRRPLRVLIDLSTGARDITPSA